jgi:hypothetical protein
VDKRKRQKDTDEELKPFVWPDLTGIHAFLI